MTVCPEEPEESIRIDSGPAESIWTKKFILLCITNLFVLIEGFALITCLPPYILSLGGQVRDIGFITVGFSISVMLMRPLSGWLLNIFGFRKPMVIGLAAIVLISIMYYYAKDFQIIIVVRILHGLMFGYTSTAISAMTVAILPKSRLSEGMGYFGFAATIAMSIAPMLGLWLVNDFGYSYAFLFIIFSSIIAFVCSLFVRSENIPAAVAITPKPPLVSWTSLFEKESVPAAMTVLFISIAYSSIGTFISVYGASRGLANVGIFFIANSVTMLVTRPFSGRWVDRGHTSQVMFAGLIFLISGMIVTAFAYNIPIFILAGALTGIGIGFCYPTLQFLAVRFAPHNRLGTALATYFFLMDFGLGFGALFWGYVAQAQGYQAMYLFSNIPLLVSIILTAYFLKNQWKKNY